MRPLAFTAAFIFTASLVLGCGDKSEPPVEHDCSSDDDCGLHETCGGGTCRPIVIGGACAEAGDCSPGLFCASQLPGGYCTLHCSEEADCPPGSECVIQGGAGICLSKCANDEDCREGYTCTSGVCFLACASNAECDGGEICLEGKCQGSGVGLPCQNEQDCATGLECLLESRGGYCTTPCGTACPVGSRCGHLLGEETCLAACRIDEDCGAGRLCHQGGCIIPCTDADCEEGFQCMESGLCKPSSQSGRTVIDLGAASDGQRLEFDVPEGTQSITLIVQGAEQSTFKFTSIVDPEGTERITGLIDMGGGEGLTTPHRTMPRHHVNATQIPNSDLPGMHVIPGSWSFTFSGGSAGAFVVLKRGNEEAGTLPLNVFVAPQAFPGFDASNLADSPHFRVVLGEWDNFFLQQTNIALGEIRYFDLPPEYTDVEVDILGGASEFEEMFKRFGRDDGLNAFFVKSISSLIGVIAGVSGGIPGPPRTADTLHSGIVIAVQADPRDTGLVFCHEAGHFQGLFHTSEQNIFEFLGVPQIHDMLTDTPECRPGKDACTESRRHLMFPALDPAMELLSPASAMVVRAFAGLD